MIKLIATIIVSTLILGSCSTMKDEIEKVPASQYKGQDFQPLAEKVLSHMRKIS